MILDLVEISKKYNLQYDAVAHIGAHYGLENDVYDALNIPDGNRHFFEPQPHVFRKLEKNITKSHLYNFALADYIGESLFFVEFDNDSQSSSLLEPKIHTSQYPHIKFTGQIKVEVKTLDSILKEIDPEFAKKKWLLNIDTQGSELMALKGASDLLPYVVGVNCEVNIAELYKGCPMESEISSFLSNFDLTRKEINMIGGTWGDAFYASI